MKTLHDINKKTIGKMIRVKRVKTLDMSRTVFAKKVGKTATDIGKYERGINLAPSDVTEKLRFMVEEYLIFESESGQ